MNYNLHPNFEQAPLACPRCGAIDAPAPVPGAGPHAASARCRHCGRLLRWLSTHTPEECQAQRQQAMAHRPPSQAQLAYLQALGDAGPVPSTMAEGSARIHALRRGEGQ
jgi:hypothetical protein